MQYRVNAVLVYMPIFALFNQEPRSFQGAVSKGTCSIERLAVHTLKSIWKRWNQDKKNIMKKLRTLWSVSLLMAGLTIPNRAVAEDKTAVDPVAYPESREIKLTGKLLLVPVSRVNPRKGEQRYKLSIRVDGGLVHHPEIVLAQKREEVLWWAYLDMSEYVGKTAVLAISNPVKRAGLALIESSDKERHLLPLYDEKMRPQFHHSQKQGWSNDPNGLVYYDGEYHVYWQCNPVNCKTGGNTYWGHSSSPDMIHWTEHRRALRPSGGAYNSDRHPSLAHGMCFSGSAHVDVNNSGGWQTGEEKVMVAVFTDAGLGEALAYSNDRGMNWTYYDKNPIIKHRGRDPKLIWYEPGKHWVISVFANPGWAVFYTSKDLKEWTRSSALRGYNECPEVFELPVDGDKHNTRSVIFGGDAKYAIGTFDGKTFTPEHEGKHTLHYGKFYASQCFNNPPDGRVVQMGWAMINMGADMPFNQAFSLPISLTLRKTKEGIRMFANPVEELNRLRDGKPQTLTAKTATEETPVTLGVDGQLADILVTIRKGDAKKVSLNFGRNAVTYDFSTEMLDKIPVSLVDGKLKLRVLIDRPMFEVVVNDGGSYLTESRQPAPLETVSVSAEGGSVTVELFEVYKMKSIWKKENF